MRLGKDCHVGDPVNLYYRTVVAKVLNPARIIHSWGPVRDLCHNALRAIWDEGHTR